MYKRFHFPDGLAARLFDSPSFFLAVFFATAHRHLDYLQPFAPGNFFPFRMALCLKEGQIECG